jgi:hypothetical protein
MLCIKEIVGFVPECWQAAHIRGNASPLLFDIFAFLMIMQARR